jgi:6-phosphofructokinase 1
MAKRIGILTGGGDCPGLNAAIRAVVKHATNSYGYEVLGIEDAFKGLYESRVVPLTRDKVRGLLDRGGTILGSSNRANPFAYPVRKENGEEVIEDVSERCLETLRDFGVEALIVVGGDGTMGIAHKFSEKGVNVVGIPKTIDNDLEATESTIGFNTAVSVATAAIDRLHSTAESHDRIIICEVMGRYAGWIALHAGMGSGAEAILLPEVDYDIERLMACFKRRQDRGITFSIVVIAEGAKPRGGDLAVVQSGDPTQQERLGGAGHRLAAQIMERGGYDVRVTVLGHVQRGGTPTVTDRILATRFGVEAVELVRRERYGHVAALRAGAIVDVPIELAVAKLKRVQSDGPMIRAARSLGIELGF